MKHLFSTLFALMLTASTLCWETGAAQAAGDIDPKLRKPFIDHTLKYKDCLTSAPMEQINGIA